MLTQPVSFINLSLVIGIYIYCRLQKRNYVSYLKFVYANNCYIQNLDEKYQNWYMTIY